MIIPKLAIFDMDGLIFNTERQFFKHQCTVLKKYGYPARLEDFLQSVGLAFNDVKVVHKRIYGDDFSTEKIYSETRELIAKDVEENGLDIMPGIPELLDFFKKNNVVCCVASSSVTPLVEKYLKISGLSKYIDYAIGGDMVEHSKPNPEIFLKSLEKTPFSKDEAVIFEDSENGIRAANAAGIPVICIPDLKYPNDDLKDIPIHIVESAFDVIDLMK